MNTIKVYSRLPLQGPDLQKIRDVLKMHGNSKKLLGQTFSRYHGMDLGGIHFDAWYPEGHTYSISY